MYILHGTNTCICLAALSGFAGRKATMMAGGALTTVGGILPSAAYHIWLRAS